MQGSNRAGTAQKSGRFSAAVQLVGKLLQLNREIKILVGSIELTYVNADLILRVSW